MVPISEMLLRGRCVYPGKSEAVRFRRIAARPPCCRWCPQGRKTRLSFLQNLFGRSETAKIFRNIHANKRPFGVFAYSAYSEHFSRRKLFFKKEIDILSDSGIIICERSADRTLLDVYPGLYLWREYRYGSAAVTIYRKT